MKTTSSIADYWTTVVRVLASVPVRCRMGIVGGSESIWGCPIFSPVPGYVEGSLGPFSAREVCWIDVESCEQRRRGRLVPDVTVDHSATLLASFEQHRLCYDCTEYGYRILPPSVA